MYATTNQIGKDDSDEDMDEGAEEPDETGQDNQLASVTVDPRLFPELFESETPTENTPDKAQFQPANNSVRSAVRTLREPALVHVRWVPPQAEPCHREDTAKLIQENMLHDLELITQYLPSALQSQNQSQLNTQSPPQPPPASTKEPARVTALGQSRCEVQEQKVKRKGKVKGNTPYIEERVFP